MTDDRADRIRRIRNRAKSGRGEGSTDDSTDETTETKPETSDGGADEPADASLEDRTDADPDGADADETDADEADVADASNDGASADEPSEDTETTADGEELSFREGGVRPPTQQPQSAQPVQPAAAQGGTGDGHDTAASSGQYGGSVGTIGIANQYGTEPTVDATVDTSQGFSEGPDDAVFVESDTLVATAHHDDDTVQVLEFFLGDDRYAIEIERISAIVEMKEITRFPRGPNAIDGVTDLRGEITAILDPTALLDIERVPPADDQYIVVLKRSEDKQKLGVRVSDVSQAVTYHDDQIEETAAVGSAEIDHEYVSNIIKKGDDEGAELVAWLDMDDLIEAID